MTQPEISPEQAFTQELLAHGLLISCGVPGVFGKGRAFEAVLAGLERLITDTVSEQGAEFMRFPPIINRKDFERGEFLNSMPQLAGSVSSFAGTDAQHRELLRRIHDGEDWGELQSMTQVVLTPAACYPLYPLCTGSLPEAGRLVDVSSWCFRHEYSDDPARMQMFRMRELVHLGEPDTVVAWRDTWQQQGLSLLRSLGLPVVDAPASDPFFGRGGRLLVANQLEQKLKFELLVHVASPVTPTAVMSFNYHQDHFGGLFGIRTAAGAVAHTACMAFGMERIVLALFKLHGFLPAAWPETVRQRLWL